MHINIIEEAKKNHDTVVSWRRALHQIPELGIELPQTVAFVAGKLAEMGIPYEVYEDCSCVAATIGKGGKCILLRGDMDALPVKEESGLPFASTTALSHACGHDFHAAALLGAAKILKEHEAELPGTVKLIFQSGEEVFKGAAGAISHGLMENPHVDAAFATHVFAANPLKNVLYGKYFCASVYGFRIRVQGKGAHGSSPENGVDPLTVGAYILLGLQELIAREISACDEAALTIGHFEGGNAPNVIPDSAILEGTLRAFKPEIRAYIMQRITEIAESIAKAYRATVTVEELSSCPSVICDDGMMAMLENAVAELDNGMTLVPGIHLMGSEDFACYAERVPAVICFLGAGVEDQSKWVGQHNPKIIFNEDVLENEVALYVKMAIDFLEKNK
ncbi:MAG: amidohydrolase [Oscillospiraceae bacterium]|nr:amidohydrolase [Oscillospiraceae bacterium]